jgi:hypothetical protein
MEHIFPKYQFFLQTLKPFTFETDRILQAYFLSSELGLTMVHAYFLLSELG